MAMTAPGQTTGVSVFIDPLIEDLGISRTQVSTAYLAGTLIGACAMPLVGRAIDRYGPRRVIAAVGAVFGAVLIALAFVTGIVGLTAGFVGVRMAGQGALSLVATTTVAYWFDKRRGLALGITSAIGTAGISLAPLLIERLISAYGWRQAWAIEGIAVWLIVIPLALFGIRNRPADIGQHTDGIPPTTDTTDVPLTGNTLSQALRTGAFWSVAACLAASSMLTTGLNFHQIALLGERGLTPVEAAANFLPQTAAALLATLAAGALIDRLPPNPCCWPPWPSSPVPSSAPASSNPAGRPSVTACSSEPPTASSEPSKQPPTPATSVPPTWERSEAPPTPSPSPRAPSARWPSRWATT